MSTPAITTGIGIDSVKPKKAASDMFVKSNAYKRSRSEKGRASSNSTNNSQTRFLYHGHKSHKRSQDHSKTFHQKINNHNNQHFKKNKNN